MQTTKTDYSYFFQPHSEKLSVHTPKMNQTEQNPSFTQTANLSPGWVWWNEEMEQLFQNLGNSSAQGKY